MFEAVKELKLGWVKFMLASDSEIGARTFLEFKELKGLGLLELLGLLGGGEVTCRVGGKDGVGWFVLLDPEISGNESKRDAPKDEDGLKGVIPANPVGWG